MSAPHDELKANAAGYVLGILDAGERREFEAHLAACGECAAEVASLRPVIGVLATAVPQVTPRAEVRARVLGHLRIEQARRGEQRAVEELLTRHRESVRRIDPRIDSPAVRRAR